LEPGEQAQNGPNGGASSTRAARSNPSHRQGAVAFQGLLALAELPLSP
jgi:hypothetical protein